MCSGFLRPEKIHRPRAGLKSRILDLEASTLPEDTRVHIYANEDDGVLSSMVFIPWTCFTSSLSPKQLGNDRVTQRSHLEQCALPVASPNSPTRKESGVTENNTPCSAPVQSYGTGRKLYYSECILFVKV